MKPDLDDLRGAFLRAEAAGPIHRGEWVILLPDGRVRAAREPDREIAGREPVTAPAAP